ncbi:hypothetical protein N9165_03425 [Akkermansiaceae bacterium]|nr:hypothetical protein [Akkermansiaceae bacterium]
MPNEEEQLSTLPHSIAPPEDFLPDTPIWVWVMLAITAFLIVLGLIFLIRFFMQRTRTEMRDHSTNPYQEAANRLITLSNDLSEKPLALVATEISMILRGCLSKVLRDPALYETDEELALRSKALEGVPASVRNLLEKLSASKYAPSFGDDVLAQALIEEGQKVIQKFEQSQNALAEQEAQSS